MTGNSFGERILGVIEIGRYRDEATREFSLVIDRRFAKPPTGRLPRIETNANASGIGDRLISQQFNVVAQAPRNERAFTKASAANTKSKIESSPAADELLGEESHV